MRIKQRKVLWIVIITLLLCFFYYLGRPQVPLTDNIWGAYRKSTCCWVSFETPYVENDFYYTDSEADYYIKGEFEEIYKDTYFLVCSDNENKQIIPDQEIVIKDRSITLQINNQRITFQKVSDVPYFADVRSTYSRERQILRRANDDANENFYY